VGAWLLGKVLKVIRRLPSLFRSSADDLPRGIAFRGTVWRAVPHQFADDAWEMTAKNIANHHRYSGTGRGALYAGTSHTTALKEILAYKIDPATRTFVSKEVVLDNLLDLTDPAVRDWLGVSLADLTQTTGDRVGDYFLPNAIGDFARSRYNGLLVPSARHPAGKNLVMFTPL
jgi:filamentous hemagglutinin